MTDHNAAEVARVAQPSDSSSWAALLAGVICLLMPKPHDAWDFWFAAVLAISGAYAVGRPSHLEGGL